MFRLCENERVKWVYIGVDRGVGFGYGRVDLGGKVF